MADFKKILMYAPVVKSASGGYLCVLSDDSIDRENEIIGKSFLDAVALKMDYLPALANHENNVFMQVGEWTNKRIEKINGHNSLVAEPKFYKSNPNAQIIKGMLNEGAKIGLSIGAIPKAKKDTQIDGKTYTEYTEGELLEASFVAIPANKHALAMGVAKSLNLNLVKDMEANKLEKEDIEKLISEANKDLSEKIDSLVKTVETLTKENEEPAPEPEPIGKDKSDAAASEDDELKNENKSLKDELRDLKSKYKQESDNPSQIEKTGIPILR